MNAPSDSRVCAVVVTFNRKVLLRRCLLALRAQLRPGDAVLVVDNASSDGTSEMLEAEFSWTEQLRLPENIGGSGGFYEGMKRAFEQGFGYLWLMDDDGLPGADCLGKLLSAGDDRTVAVPLQQDSGGRLYGISAWKRRVVDVTATVVGRPQPVAGPFMFSFVGPLVPRAVIEQLGLPVRDFFIWFDDYEYSLRIVAHAGLRVVAVPDALFQHDMGTNAREVRFLGWRSVRSETSPWKTYYGIRNPLYTLLHRRRKPVELALFVLVHVRLLLMDIVYGPERAKRVRMRVRGFVDGVLGRLGKRVVPS